MRKLLKGKSDVQGVGGGGHYLIWAIYMYLGMCGPTGYGFSVVLVMNRVSILTAFGHKYGFCTLALICACF